MPGLETQIAIRLPHDIVAGLEALAHLHGRTRAEEARVALAGHVLAPNGTAELAGALVDAAGVIREALEAIDAASGAELERRGIDPATVRAGAAAGMSDDEIERMVLGDQAVK